MAKKVTAKKKSNAKKKPTKKTMAAAPMPAVSAPMTAAPVPAAPPAPIAPMPFVVVPSPDAALTPPKSTVTNVIDDPSVSLQRFDLLDLQPYTQEKVYSTTASRDFHLFYVGRDDVHDILKHVLSRVSVSLYLNMFGFDDEELNDIIMAQVADPNVIFVIGQSATHQISHTKGFVADGKVGGEGSTNWSSAGEGTFVVTGKPGGAGY